MLRSYSFRTYQPPPSLPQIGEGWEGVSNRVAEDGSPGNMDGPLPNLGRVRVGLAVISFIYFRCHSLGSVLYSGRGGQGGR